MRRIAVLIASAAINTLTIPAVASEYASIEDIDASRMHWEMGQPAKVAGNESTRRACAALYEAVTLRQAAARRVDGTRTLALLDSVINSFRDLWRSAEVEHDCFYNQLAVREVRR
jgi:hypothetical protein